MLDSMLLAIRDIAEGEELTIDYASFIDESMEPFACQCGSENCRKLIVFGVKDFTLLNAKNKRLIGIAARIVARDISLRRKFKPCRFARLKSIDTLIS